MPCFDLKFNYFSFLSEFSVSTLELNCQNFIKNCYFRVCVVPDNINESGTIPQLQPRETPVPLPANKKDYNAFLSVEENKAELQFIATELLAQALQTTWSLLLVCLMIRR